MHQILIWPDIQQICKPDNEYHGEARYRISGRIFDSTFERQQNKKIKQQRN
jgi:hypothetical protein